MNEGSLLRLFQSEMFDSYFHMYYLYHRREQGVHEYLVNLLYAKRSGDEITFYLPQLCQLSLCRFGSSSLYRFLLDKSARSMHLALKASWLYQSIVEDRLPGLQEAAQKMTQETEMAVVNCKPFQSSKGDSQVQFLSSPTPDLFLRKRICASLPQIVTYSLSEHAPQTEKNDSSNTPQILLDTQNCEKSNQETNQKINRNINQKIAQKIAQKSSPQHTLNVVPPSWHSQTPSETHHSQIHNSQSPTQTTSYIQALKQTKPKLNPAAKSAANQEAKNLAGGNLGKNLEENSGKNLEENSGTNLEKNLGEDVDEYSRKHLEETLGENVEENSGKHLEENLGENVEENSGKHLETNLGKNLEENIVERESGQFAGEKNLEKNLEKNVENVEKVLCESEKSMGNWDKKVVGLEEMRSGLVVREGRGEARGSPRLFESFLRNTGLITVENAKVHLPSVYRKLGFPLQASTLQLPSGTSPVGVEDELQEFVMKQRRCDYFNTLNHFISLIIDVSNSLATEPDRELRNSLLQKFLIVLNEWMLARRCIVAACEGTFAMTGLTVPLSEMDPLTQLSNHSVQIIRIDPEECKVLSSKKRAPFLLVFEIADLDEDLSLLSSRLSAEGLEVGDLNSMCDSPRRGGPPSESLSRIADIDKLASIATEMLCSKEFNNSEPSFGKPKKINEKAKQIDQNTEKLDENTEKIDQNTEKIYHSQPDENTEKIYDSQLDGNTEKINDSKIDENTQKINDSKIDENTEKININISKIDENTEKSKVYDSKIDANDPNRESKVETSDSTIGRHPSTQNNPKTNNSQNNTDDWALRAKTSLANISQAFDNFDRQINAHCKSPPKDSSPQSTPKRQNNCAQDSPDNLPHNDHAESRPKSGNTFSNNSQKHVQTENNDGENNAENNVENYAENNAENNVENDAENNAENNVENDAENNAENNVENDAENNAENNVENDAKNNAENNVENDGENNAENDAKTRAKKDLEERDAGVEELGAREDKKSENKSVQKSEQKSEQKSQQKLQQKSQRNSEEQKGEVLEMSENGVEYKRENIDVFRDKKEDMRDSSNVRAENNASDDVVVVNDDTNEIVEDDLATQKMQKLIENDFQDVGEIEDTIRLHLLDNDIPKKYSKNSPPKNGNLNPQGNNIPPKNINKFNVTWDDLFVYTALLTELKQRGLLPDGIGKESDGVVEQQSPVTILRRALRMRTAEPLHADHHAHPPLFTPPLPPQEAESPAPEKTEGQKVRNELWGEVWAEKQRRLRKSSPYGRIRSWDIRCILVKGGDDLRQELLASQLIRQFKAIFDRAKLPLWLKPYEVLVSGCNAGIMEFVPDTCSVDVLKKRFNTDTIARVFSAAFADNPFEAKKNFIESHAAYSLVSYFLQVRDRHNANLLLDAQGHLIHIDFGYMLSNSPGNFNFETSPFKLTQEFLDIMDGELSDNYEYFRTLVIRGFLEARKHADRIILMVEMMLSAIKMPCFLGGAAYALEGLRERFMEKLPEDACIDKVTDLIDVSVNNFRTIQYDNFQRITNGIL